MTPVSDQERKIIIEFCHLLEKSKQLFNGLRDLPPHGHKQWHVHFGRTFDIYSKLWKYQQQHRLLLDTRYGLKRWQIGEVASKIGQLYYHYYLRTSDTAYLVESYSFYSAIRGRHYYHLASKEIRCELMVKKLRFYARFIVVAILLQQPVIIDELVAELDKQVVAYGHVYDPNDQIEWFNVLAEVKAFLVAEPGVTVIDPIDRNRVVTIGGRINYLSVPQLERTAQMYLTLQDAIIIGSGTQLVKFSELTIDMFRMVQNLEWEVHVPPRNSSGGSPKDKQRCDIATCEPLKSAPQCRGVMDEEEASHVNPHKFLLFKPSANQVLIYLASSCNDLPPNGVLLIYISANGHPHQQNKHVEDYGYDVGGVITTSKSDIYREYNKEVKGSTPKSKESQILYPGDLHPFTRKPLFIIVDSDNSYAFQHIPRVFGQPLIILMSPLSVPSNLMDRKNQGSIFTLFLHNPIAGLCNSCDVHTIDITTWQRCVSLRDTFMKEASKFLMRIRIDPMFYAFLGDIHLRLILLRYIFCECALRMHKSFRSRTNLPRSVPPLPEELFMQEILVAKVLNMTELIGIETCFFDPLAAGPSTTD
ncbi:protein SCAI isoform X1 [Pararge aegeria]|uniref:protein SCAI isoform X1 n=1 Tax=Pararge aegeria TaxID=116150 RepID=UPI0019D1196A|nr:protein SCAI isoform X1 [Pararge aegeria]